MWFTFPLCQACSHFLWWINSISIVNCFLVMNVWPLGAWLPLCVADLPVPRLSQERRMTVSGFDFAWNRHTSTVMRSFFTSFQTSNTANCCMYRCTVQAPVGTTVLWCADDSSEFVRCRWHTAQWLMTESLTVKQVSFEHTWLTGVNWVCQCSIQLLVMNH